MKILITGGAGYIGSHTTHYLINNKIKPKDLIVFDSLISGHRELLPKGVKFIKGDLLNIHDIKKIFKKSRIDKVIHFAGYIEAGKSMKDPGKYFMVNIMGGINLLEEMRKNGCKEIVFSSSCAIYGNQVKSPIKENNSKNPINPYGECKLIFEKILEWYDRIYNIKFVSLRYFNAAGAGYGIGEKHNPETHLIPLVLRAAKNGNEMNIYGTDYNTPDGTCIRDYIHVVDLASAHLKALKYLKTNKKSVFLNLGTGYGTSVRQIIDKAIEVTGKNVKIKEVSRRMGDSAILLASNTKAKEILEWIPQKNIDQIIEDAWNWEIGQK
ncbi:MAG: UDP-glucose 4-epimerase GalE [Patescibacteria group bacterium]